MSYLDSIPGSKQLVRYMVEVDRKTYKEVSLEMKRLFPSYRGLSSRSVRRFCSAHGICATSRLTNSMLDRLVCSAVQKVQSYQYKIKISNIMFEFIRLALPMGEKP